MERFPRFSFVRTDGSLKYDFGAGLGFHVSSAAARALSSRLIDLSHDSAYECLLLPDEIQLETAAKYALGLTAGHSGLKHTVLNIERKDMYALDQFFASVEMTLDPRCCEQIVAGALRSGAFFWLPFQQFMVLDAVKTMLERSGLGEHALYVFMHLKKRLGFHWLTVSKAKALVELFSAKVVGHNVRRRMGKTVAVYSILARTLALFPAADIGALYTAHRAPAANACFEAVKEACQRLAVLFNARQAEDFYKKISARGGAVDREDFYYESKCRWVVNNSTVSVDFYVKDKRGLRDATPAATNTLRCKGYTEQDVSSSSAYPT